VAIPVAPKRRPTALAFWSDLGIATQLSVQRFYTAPFCLDLAKPTVETTRAATKDEATLERL
jgi:hypothetical protein